MRIKLHWKLALIFCSAVVFSLSIGYFYLVNNLKGYVEDNLENTLTYQILAGRDLIESQLKSHSILEADTLADRIAKQQNVRVTIISPDGRVVGDSELTIPEILKIENHLDRPEIQEAISKGRGLSKRYSKTIKRHLLYMAVTFAKEGLRGFLRYSIPISYIEILKARLYRLISVALVVVFLFSLGFTLIISLRVSKPLEEIAEVAKNMAEGDFSKKPSIYSKDEIGELARALSYMSDEIKKRIDETRQESAKLDTVLSSMFEGEMVVDEKGRILLMNPSLRKLFFVDSSFENRSPIEVIRNPQVQDAVDKILKDKENLFSKEITISQPEERAFKINATPIIQDGVLKGAVLVFHEITELRKLERIRQDFVANVSHELRTPISSIKGYAETLLGEDIEDKHTIREFIEIIYQDSHRLANLIDDLLDLSKIESDKMNMVFEPLEVKPILERCLRVLDKMIKAKNLSLTVDISLNTPKVLADAKRISQVFLNLLDNAIKYTPEAGSIKIRIFSKDKFVQVDISDTGIGIPEKDLSRIFERFYRVDKARSRGLGGTGLGLSIVKHIILAHNGQVWVNSKEGFGSTFSFTIPQA